MIKQQCANILNSKSFITCHHWKTRLLKKKLNKTAKDVTGQIKHAPETAISQKHGETEVPSWRTFPTVKRHSYIHFLFLLDSESTTTSCGYVSRSSLMRTRMCTSISVISLCVPQWMMGSTQAFEKCPGLIMASVCTFWLNISQLLI